ncbi:MAG: GtrA family protein [Lachnospiraceae bacterium]|nr:GtrA family protein [Lachnospiraceae bacterium]
MKKIKELLIQFKEQISYLFFGVLTTGVNWVVYALLMLIPAMTVELANAVAGVVAILFAYITNRIFVFESVSKGKKDILLEFLRFLGGRAVTFVIEVVGVPGLYYLGLSQGVFGIEGAWAKIIVSVVVIVLNYVFSKLFVFKSKR